MQLHILLLFLFSLFFTSCGLQKDGSSTNFSTKTGFFIDAVVEGVEYETNLHSGLTQSDGSFTYSLSDTEISFKIGGIILPKYNLQNINTDQKILPTDLVGVARNESNNTKVVQILQILQSLDDDGNASNGINITATRRLSLIDSTINFIENNISQSDLNTTFSDINVTLISQEIATQHFEDTLRKTFDIVVDTVAPIFTAQNSITILENTTFITSLNIIDSGSIASLTLGGVDKDFLDINTTAISLKNAADFETKSSYVFNVTAVDDSNNSITKEFVITIANVDETAPVITSTNNITLDENQFTAITITATDRNTLTYSILGGDSNFFDINSTNGVITFKIISDFETQTSYTFNVQVSDGVFTSTDSILITLNNIIDKKPIISAFSASILEDKAPLSVVGTITVTQVGDSNITSFDLNDTQTFTIDSNGVIQTRVALDYETTQQFSLTVTATNTAGVSDPQAVTITIGDVVDTVATLSSFTGSISENQNALTIIGTVQVADTGDTNITSFRVDDTNNFLIDTQGVITSKVSFDYEVQQVYNFNVFASNEAGESISQNATVNITNDTSDDNTSDTPSANVQNMVIGEICTVAADTVITRTTDPTVIDIQVDLDSSITTATLISGSATIDASVTCVESNTTTTAKSFSITAVDGYIVKIITPATATCGATIYSTDANATVTLGLLKFNGIDDKTGCRISVPSDAIIDSNGDNIYTSADENNSIGYEMKADGNDTYVTQFTTLVQDYITAGDTTKASNLKAVVKDYNPVASISDATSDDNTSRAKAIQLMVLGEAIKTMKKAGALASSMIQLDTTTTLTAITNNSTDVNVTAMIASLPATFKAAAKAKADVIKTVAVALKTMKENATTKDIDFAKFIISVSDGGKSITDAIKEASDLNTTQIAAISDINTTLLDLDVTTATTLAQPNAPALVALGSILKIGDVTIVLPANGNFGTVEIDVNSSSKLANFSKIELLPVTTSKGFQTQKVTLIATATNSEDATNYAQIIIGKDSSGEATGLTLLPNDTNTSVTLSMVGAPIVVTLAKIGSSPTTYSTSSNTLVNTDFTFDICSIVGCTNNNSVINDLENFLKIPAKTYDINITITSENTDTSVTDQNVTYNYKTIIGKITTK